VGESGVAGMLNDLTIEGESMVTDTSAQGYRTEIGRGVVSNNETESR